MGRVTSHVLIFLLLWSSAMETSAVATAAEAPLVWMLIIVGSPVPNLFACLRAVLLKVSTYKCGECYCV